MNAQEALLRGRVAARRGKVNSCDGKFRYWNYTKAAKAVKEIMERKQAEKDPYPCPFCFGWHIGRKMSAEEIEYHTK